MKRCFAVLLALTLLLAGALPARAAETYTLDALGLSMTVPDGYVTITRDTDPDDPLFDWLALDGQEIITYMETNGIYLNALMESDYTQEIVVTMTEQIDYKNLVGYSDVVLEGIASILMENYSSWGISVLDYELYRHPQTKFIKVHFYDPASMVYGMQYYTIIDYKAMNFTLRSTGEDLNYTQEASIQSMVDSIQFMNVAQEPAETSEAFTYTDEKSGLTFTVPAGWEESPPSQEYETIDVVFSSQQEMGLMMYYGSLDIWEETPADGKIGYSRSDIDNSLFTGEDIAGSLGIPFDDVQKVTCGGKSYFRAEQSQTDDSYGVEMTFDFIYLIRVENGWAYLFQFVGAADSAYYGDFESLVASAVYPTAAGASPDDGGPSGDTSPFGGSVVLVLLIVGAVVVVAGVLAAILVPVLVVRSRKKKAARAAAALPPANPAPPAAPGQPPYAPPAASWQPVAPPPARDSSGGPQTPPVPEAPPAAPASSEPLGSGAPPAASQAGAGFVPPPANPAPPAASWQPVAPPPAQNGSGGPQTPPVPEAQPAVSPPAAAGGEAAPALTCPACGSRMPSDSRFCPACGARVAQGEEGR